MRRCCSSIRRCSASARWRSASLRARARSASIRARWSASRRASLVAAALLVRHAALLFRLAPSRLVLALLARQQVAPDLLVLPPPRIPVALVLVRALFSLAPLLVVEAAELERIERSRRGCTR